MGQKFSLVKYAISILKLVLHKRIHLRRKGRTQMISRHYQDFQGNNSSGQISSTMSQLQRERQVSLQQLRMRCTLSFPWKQAALLTFPQRSGSSEQTMPFLPTSYPRRIPDMRNPVPVSFGTSQPSERGTELGPTRRRFASHSSGSAA